MPASTTAVRLLTGVRALSLCPYSATTPSLPRSRAGRSPVSAPMGSRTGTPGLGSATSVTVLARPELSHSEQAARTAPGPTTSLVCAFVDTDTVPSKPAQLQGRGEIALCGRDASAMAHFPVPLYRSFESAIFLDLFPFLFIGEKEY
ncbi:hypothetical protein BDW66DRAFT_128593 [Aspergillus desertorum]